MPDCDLNYCRIDWHTFPIFDEGFCDCTVGICPAAQKGVSRPVGRVLSPLLP
jgi:hypothetical protein